MFSTLYFSVLIMCQKYNRLGAAKANSSNMKNSWWLSPAH
uniref:Uncharacterized protein n=1 Tax=Arundo donax TaxID=35708 RepID=A0A0A9D1N6_ARUDO